MRKMFSQTHTFNENLSTKKVTHLGQTYIAWDTQRVTDMNGMFENANEFNGNISNWNVSNCTNFTTMFKQTRKFNRDISTKIITGDDTYPSYIAWDTISGTEFTQTLANAYAFKQDVSNWNTSKARIVHFVSIGSLLMNTQSVHMIYAQKLFCLLMKMKKMLVKKIK